MAGVNSGFLRPILYMSVDSGRRCRRAMLASYGFCLVFAVVAVPRVSRQVFSTAMEAVCRYHQVTERYQYAVRTHQHIMENPRHAHENCSPFYAQLLNENGKMTPRGLHADYPAHCVGFRGPGNRTFFRIPLPNRRRYATAGLSLYVFG